MGSFRRNRMSGKISGQDLISAGPISRYISYILILSRPDNGGSKTNVSLEERGISESRHQPDQPHFFIDRTMNEVSKSLSNLKQNFVSSSSSSVCNYKIISINKDEKTNQHSIRIGIDDDTTLKRSQSVGASVGRDYDSHDGGHGGMPFQM